MSITIIPARQTDDGLMFIGPAEDWPNFANGNAAAVFDALGCPPRAYEDGTANVAAFTEMVRTALGLGPGQEAPTYDFEVAMNQDLEGATRNRLVRLLELTQTPEATHITWGY